MNTKVTGIHTENGRITGADTTGGEIRADWIINATGLFCDEIAANGRESGLYGNAA